MRRPTCPTTTLVLGLALLAPLLAPLLGAARAREPLPPEPLPQSRLVAGFLATFRLPDEVRAGVARSERESAAARLLSAPDLTLHERAALGPQGAHLDLSATLDLPLVAPTNALDLALAETGAAMTRLDVLDERAWALRTFLELLVHLEHTEDTLAALREATTTVWRERPAWLAQPGAADAVPLDELAAATQARLALADLRELERQRRDLRRRLVEASGTPSARSRPIARDLPLLDDAPPTAPGPDPWTLALDTCAGTSTAAARARLAARSDALAQRRDAAAALPTLALGLEGELALGAAATPLAGGVRLALSVRLPAWQPLTGALDVTVAPGEARQEVRLGWPNRYPAEVPPAGLEPDPQAQATIADTYRELLDAAATLADLRGRHAALFELDRRVGPLLRDQARGDGLQAIDATRRRAVTRSQRLDLEASIRLVRLDLAYVCRRGPFAVFAP